MPDLGVRLAGVELKNPVICGAGERTMTAADVRAAIAAGAAAVVAKSVNESEAAREQLRASEYVAVDAAHVPVDRPGAGDPVSLHNRSGLADVDFEEWAALLADLDAEAAARDAYVIGSIVVADPARAGEMCAGFERAGLRLVEVNVGAPHAGESAAGAISSLPDPAGVGEVVGRIRADVSIPLLVKLSGESADMGESIAAASGAGADAVVLATRQLGFLPDPDAGRPLLRTFAAVGGGWALPLTLRHVAKARARFGPELGIVATNGVRSGLDVARALLAGARAVEAYTVVHLGGHEELGRLVRELEDHLAGRGAAASDLIGEATDHTLTYAEAAATRGGS
jgi:dihydroorotate dehydrogenase (NAD+) catalytic subunit